MPCAQYLTLQLEWPKTTKALERYALPKLAESVTDDKGHNPAGYVLYQLRRAYRHAQTVHGEVRGCLAVCDDQFSREVSWHQEKKTVFRNLIPAVGTCWYNLVHERSERFREFSLARPGVVSTMGDLCNEIAVAARSRQA